MPSYAGAAWHRVGSGREPPAACATSPLWRGDLSPLGCAAAPKVATLSARHTRLSCFGAASRPSGDKSPHHSCEARLTDCSAPSAKPRILAPLPTTTPESAGLCALHPGSIVSLSLTPANRLGGLVSKGTTIPLSVIAMLLASAFVMTGCARIPSGMPGSFHFGPPTLCNPSPQLLGGSR
jgi:hypothetical protein